MRALFGELVPVEAREAFCHASEELEGMSDGVGRAAMAVTEPEQTLIEAEIARTRNEVTELLGAYREGEHSLEAIERRLRRLTDAAALLDRAGFP